MRSKNVNQLKAGAMLSYLSMGIGYIVSIVYTPIMLRLLGQSEYGLYNLVASVVSYLGVLNFGFGSAYMRYYLRYKVQNSRDKIAALNGMFLIIFSAIGIIAVAAGIALTLNTEIIFGNELTNYEIAKAKILITILVINLALSFPTVVFNSHVTANEKFIFQKIIQIIRTIANPFVILPILILGYGSVGMVVATSVLNLIVEIINVIYCFKILKIDFSFKSFDFTLMKEMAVYSSYIFLTMVIDQINWNVDKFILGRFHGTVSVAIYGLAAQLNTYYMSISTAISNVFVPRVHKLVWDSENNEELTTLFTKIGRIQFIILSLISSGLIFFGKPFIYFWAGKAYEESYAILLLLIIPVTIPLIQNIGIEIQRAKNMHQFRSWIYFFIAVGNLVITIPLGKLYGGLGAALGTAISITIGNVIIMNWYYKNRVKLDMTFFWKQIVRFIPSLTIPFIAGINICIFIDLYNIINFVLSGIVYVTIFCFSMWFIGMNQYEKDLLINPIRMYYKGNK